MSKKRKNQHLTKRKNEDFGTYDFYCQPCDYHFEMDWEDIWAIQEVTHGYVGFHTNDTFISCPKCDKVVSDE